MFRTKSRDFMDLLMKSGWTSLMLEVLRSGVNLGTDFCSLG